jgi:hypothetical protein
MQRLLRNTIKSDYSIIKSVFFCCLDENSFDFESNEYEISRVRRGKFITQVGEMVLLFRITELYNLETQEALFRECILRNLDSHLYARLPATESKLLHEEGL